MAKGCKDVNIINLDDIQRVKSELKIGDRVMVVKGDKDSVPGRIYPVIGKSRYFFTVKRNRSVECFGYTELLAEEGTVRIVS